VEIRIDLESGFKLHPGILSLSHTLEDLSQLVMGHIVVGTEFKSPAVKTGCLPGILT
jgi:hypothetical protein